MKDAVRVAEPVSLLQQIQEEEKAKMSSASPQQRSSASTSPQPPTPVTPSAEDVHGNVHATSGIAWFD